MRHNSIKAAKKPSKGGLPNTLFVHAGVETLPEELQGAASHISILLPWGTLLKAVALPDKTILQNIAKLCRKQATLKIIFGYETDKEKNVIEELGLPLLTPEYLQKILKPAYHEAGFDISWQFISQAELKQLPTAWAKKLAYGKKRLFFEITGKYAG